MSKYGKDIIHVFYFHLFFHTGLAYLGIAFHSKNQRRLDTMKFQLGIVDPASGAERAQKLVHRKIDNQRPNGWDNQLKNEPGLAIIYERKLRLLQGGASEAPGFDIIAHLGGRLF